jgi:hypothetical protein
VFGEKVEMKTFDDGSEEEVLWTNMSSLDKYFLDKHVCTEPNGKY